MLIVTRATQPMMAGPRRSQPAGVRRSRRAARGVRLIAGAAAGSGRKPDWRGFSTSSAQPDSASRRGRRLRRAANFDGPSGHASYLGRLSTTRAPTARRTSSVWTIRAAVAASVGRNTARVARSQPMAAAAVGASVWPRSRNAARPPVIWAWATTRKAKESDPAEGRQ